MNTQAIATTGADRVTAPGEETSPGDAMGLCTMLHMPLPVLPADLDPNRAHATLENRNRWALGTVIHYYILPSDDATEQQKAVLRWAFKEWRDLGIGLELVEVPKESEAELRILFDFDYGRSSSYIGAYNLKILPPAPTMRFGWDLQTSWGRATAIHEIGHALGLKHEHQNPKAGIVWNEPAVYAHYRKTNGWTDAEIRTNVLNQLEPGEITNTDWDVYSVMHYPIAKGLIKEPEPYRQQETPRNTALSQRDRSLILGVYPPAPAMQHSLSPLALRRLDLQSSQQADLMIRPEQTREYELRTVGKSDAKLILFEKRDDAWRFLAGDDDAAEERNAAITVRLVEGREYKLTVRLYLAYGGTGFGVMMV